MNKVILRFCIVKNKEVFEAIFDTRLSFNENFNLLKGDDSFKEVFIFDLDKMIALRKDILIAEYNFQNFTTLYIF